MSYQWKVSLYVVMSKNVVTFLERGTSYCLMRSQYRPKLINYGLYKYLPIFDLHIDRVMEF